jgi:hypothetical protein
MQKLKRHGNGGSCFKKHEKLKIKIFAERVMESHIYRYTFMEQLYMYVDRKVSLTGLLLQ